MKSRIRRSNFFSVCFLLAIVLGCTEKNIESYYPDGSLKSRWSYEADTLTGERTDYWPNGNIRQVQSFVKGRANGPYIEYYENGFVAQKAIFHDNTIRGRAFKFYAHQEGLIEKCTYYLDVEGKQFIYFVQHLDSAGNILSEERTLSFSYDCDNGLRAEMNFEGNFEYDSVYIVLGQFTENFKAGNELDTARITRLPLSIRLGSDKISENYFRGKCIFYNSTDLGDSIRVDVKTRYFEELIEKECIESF